jgi:hypothetical protein
MCMRSLWLSKFLATPLPWLCACVGSRTACTAWLSPAGVQRSKLGFLLGLRCGFVLALGGTCCLQIYVGRACIQSLSRNCRLCAVNCGPHSYALQTSALHVACVCKVSAGGGFLEACVLPLLVRSACTQSLSRNCWLCGVNCGPHSYALQTSASHVACVCKVPAGSGFSEACVLTLLVRSAGV